VIVDGAGGVRPTHTRAGVATLVIEARLVPRTLRVDHTLRLALNIGVAHIVEDASTGSGLAPLRAISIAAAGRGVAGLNLLNWSWGC
jgi:hypothetical protein